MKTDKNRLRIAGHSADIAEFAFPAGNRIDAIAIPAIGEADIHRIGMRRPLVREEESLRAVGRVRRINELRRLILLAAINHPELLHDLLSDFAEIEITSADLDSLRRQIIDVAALGEDLDGGALKSQLNQRGFGPLLARIPFGSIGS